MGDVTINTLEVGEDIQVDGAGFVAFDQAGIEPGEMAVQALVQEPHPEQDQRYATCDGQQPDHGPKLSGGTSVLTAL